jgi:hypothetical protein
MPVRFSFSGSEIKQNQKTERRHRALGCERGVRVSLVSWHAPVTGHPALSRGLLSDLMGTARAGAARAGSNTASHGVPAALLEHGAADRVKAARRRTSVRSLTTVIAGTNGIWVSTDGGAMWSESGTAGEGCATIGPWSSAWFARCSP